MTGFVSPEDCRVFQNWRFLDLGRKSVIELMSKCGVWEGDATDEATMIHYSKTGANNNV